MILESLGLLARWSALDTWIVVIGALAAMACALPGNYLVVRRQSMMGDALSHTALPGIVMAFLFSHFLRDLGLLSEQTQRATMHAFMFGGALLIGILAAVLTQWVQRRGQVEASAALGVVYATLFAIGLLTLRLFVDHVDIDPDCVLYGTLETVVIDRDEMIQTMTSSGLVLLLNLVLVALFFKELRISAFDPALATTLGINARVIHYGLMAVTAATLVMAFESVGSILVVAMLIAPPATAYLLTDRLWLMILLSLLLAAACALSGHAMAIVLPPIVIRWFGFEGIEASASTSGMMAVAAGLLFVAAMLFGPRYGVISKLSAQVRLTLRIAREDLLGLLYRLEEKSADVAYLSAGGMLEQVPGVSRLAVRVALRQLIWNGRVAFEPAGYRLTKAGRRSARKLVRSHRLWEAYMAKHFDLPDDHLHDTASRVEHFIDPEIREELAGELKGPYKDPHGSEIPPEKEDGR